MREWRRGARGAVGSGGGLKERGRGRTRSAAVLRFSLWLRSKRGRFPGAALWRERPTGVRSDARAGTGRSGRSPSGAVRKGARLRPHLHRARKQPAPLHAAAPRRFRPARCFAVSLSACGAARRPSAGKAGRAPEGAAGPELSAAPASPAPPPLLDGEPQRGAADGAARLGSAAIANTNTWT